MERLLEFPFSGYKGYDVWHKKEGRWYVCLVPIPGTALKRTTITKAKYLMSLKYGRILTKDEEVDHIDGDKLNDDISNLQVLTIKEHKEKSANELRKLRPRYLLEKIVLLRKQNKSFIEIGKLLDISRWQAGRIYREASNLES